MRGSRLRTLFPLITEQEEYVIDIMFLPQVYVNCALGNPRYLSSLATFVNSYRGKVLHQSVVELAYDHTEARFGFVTTTEGLLTLDHMGRLHVTAHTYEEGWTPKVWLSAIFEEIPSGARVRLLDRDYSVATDTAALAAFNQARPPRLGFSQTFFTDDDLVEAVTRLTAELHGFAEAVFWPPRA